MAQTGSSPQDVAMFENATWSRCAKTYVEGFGALVAEALDPLFQQVGVRRRDTVLDVGTGPGLAAARAREQGGDVVGIDFSESMVATARALHPDIPFQVAPAEALPFEDETFDVVIGNFVLHHSGQPERLLSEAQRVLRPGGRAAFTVWGDRPSSRRSACSSPPSRNMRVPPSFRTGPCSASATSTHSTT